MSTLHERVIKQLEKKLAEIEALPELPDLSSGEYEAKFRELSRKETAAVYATIVLLPDDVRELLAKIMQVTRSKMDIG